MANLNSTDDSETTTFAGAFPFIAWAEETAPPTATTISTNVATEGNLFISLSSRPFRLDSPAEQPHSTMGSRRFITLSVPGQRFDGVELCGLPCREVADHDTRHESAPTHRSMTIPSLAPNPGTGVPPTAQLPGVLSSDSSASSSPQRRGRSRRPWPLQLPGPPGACELDPPDRSFHVEWSLEPHERRHLFGHNPDVLIRRDPPEQRGE